MTQVIYIEVISNSKFKKVITTSSRTPEQFCIDACEYYASKSIETEIRCSQKDPRFCGVFSCKNDKLMAIAGPEKNKFFWSKYTLIKKNIEEANGEFIRPKRQNKNFYAVISKEYTGFILKWTRCKELTDGKSAKFKGFNGLEEAKVWMRENNAPSVNFENVTDLKQIK
ncbi:ribonuclease H1 domain-containing protein [Mogibacterium diversum]|uniref:ribonuclease H1 domain-containing protein n=1 Tax=Mogibacterium diversum TaxID=114527 RepID=UPI0026E9B6B8|nr:viroplasmin family protein [Mogibacterium diversum]